MVVSRKSSYVSLTDVNTPVFVKLDNDVSSAYREDLKDIVVVNPDTGVLIPRLIYGSKTSGKGLLVYREPSCDASNGGSEVSIQCGGASVNESNDADTFANNFSLGADAIFAYLMEQDSGAIIDSAGNYDSTDEGNLTYGNTGITGKAIGFNGNNSYITVGALTELNAATEFTLISWLKPASWDLNAADLLHYEDEAHQLQFFPYVYGAGSYECWIGDGASKAKCAMPLNPSTYDLLNEWNMYTYCYDGGESGNANKLKGFFNTTQINIVFYDGNVPAALQTISATGKIGRSSSSFDGDMDTKILYNKAVCGDRLTDIYNNKKEYASNTTLNKGPFSPFSKGGVPGLHTGLIIGT